MVLIAILALVAGGTIGITMLLGDGESGGGRVSQPVLRGPPERPKEVCAALPTFAPRALEEFVVEARRVAPRADVTIGWYLEADSTTAKGRLARDLRSSGFRVESFPIYGDSWAITAKRRVELTVRAVRRQRQRVDAASTAKGDRFVLPTRP